MKDLNHISRYVYTNGKIYKAVTRRAYLVHTNGLKVIQKLIMRSSKSIVREALASNNIWEYV